VRIPPRLQRWLLAGDPSVRYRVLVELLGRPEASGEVRTAKRQIGRKGWAAAILGQQLPDGHWYTPKASPEGLYRPKYLATNWQLLVLSDLGVDRRNPKVSKAVRTYLRTYRGVGEIGGKDSELCFVGNMVRLLRRLGFSDEREVRLGTDWLIRTQKPDGGWHCFPSRTGTLDCWEGLAAFATFPKTERSAEMQRSIERGCEFYLERGLLHEGPEYRPWLRLHYPTHYYYDLLVGLDTLTALGYGEDRRLRPALERLGRMRNRDGSWNLDRLHPDSEDRDYQIATPFFAFGLEPEGAPSRWITLTALRVLERAGR
jgi:hypothetical protein